MGRKKIQIKPIGDEKTRLVTFAKRKSGLFKKAYELSVLCQCEIAIMVFTKSNRLYQYASKTIEHALRRRENHSAAHDFCSNVDMAKRVMQRENGGARSASRAETTTLDRGTDSMLMDESFEDSEIDDEDHASTRSGADQDSGSQRNSVPETSVFQPQTIVYMNQTRIQDSSSGSDMTRVITQLKDEKMEDSRSLITLDSNRDLIHTTSSASLTYLHSQYPSSTEMNTCNSTMTTSICATQLMQTVKETEDVEDGNRRHRLIRLDEDSASATVASNASRTSSASSNPMFVHLASGECSVPSTVSDDQTPLASLLLNERQEVRPLQSDKARLLPTTGDECPIECGTSGLGETSNTDAGTGSRLQQPAISVSLNTNDIKPNDAAAHINRLKHLYNFGVPLGHVPPYSQPTSLPIQSNLITTPSVVAAHNSLEPGLSLNSVPTAFTPVASNGNNTTVPDTVTNLSTTLSTGSTSDFRPKCGGKPLTRGLSSLGASRHKKFPALSQLKMPPVDESSSLFIAGNNTLNNATTNSLSGRLPTGTFLPTPEVESVLRNLEVPRALVAQTTQDVVRSLDSNESSAYPLDLRFTPPVPSGHTSQPSADPFNALRNVTVGGHLTSVPLPTTPTTPNPPLPSLSTPGESILTNPLAVAIPSTDSTQRCAFKAVKRSRPV